MQIPTYKLPHTFIFLSSFWVLILPTLSPPSLCISNKATQYNFFFPFSTPRWRERISHLQIRSWGAGFGELQSVIFSNDSCLGIPISAAFLHSWEMCLLPCTSCCQIWTSPCCLGTFQNAHKESMFASMEAMFASMEERLMKSTRNVSSLAVLYKALKGNWKTRASFHRLELMS